MPFWAMKSWIILADLVRGWVLLDDLSNTVLSTQLKSYYQIVIVVARYGGK